MLSIVRLRVRHVSTSSLPQANFQEFQLQDFCTIRGTPSHRASCTGDIPLPVRCGSAIAHKPVPHSTALLLIHPNSALHRPGLNRKPDSGPAPPTPPQPAFLRSCLLLPGVGGLALLRERLESLLPVPRGQQLRVQRLLHRQARVKVNLQTAVHGGLRGMGLERLERLKEAFGEEAAKVGAVLASALVYEVNSCCLRWPGGVSSR